MSSFVRHSLNSWLQSSLNYFYRLLKGHLKLFVRCFCFLFSSLSGWFHAASIMLRSGLQGGQSITHSVVIVFLGAYPAVMGWEAGCRAVARLTERQICIHTGSCSTQRGLRGRTCTRCTGRLRLTAGFKYTIFLLPSFISKHNET